MDFPHSESEQYKDRWTNANDHKAPWALQGAFISLAQGRTVSASYVDYYHSPERRTLWFGTWLTEDVVIDVTAEAESYGDAPWNFRAEANHPRALEPKVHATMFRVRDLSKFEIVEQRTTVENSHVHTDSRYRLSFGDSRLQFPRDPRIEANSTYEEVVLAIQEAWSKPA